MNINRHHASYYNYDLFLKRAHDLPENSIQPTAWSSAAVRTNKFKAFFLFSKRLEKLINIE